MNASQVNQAVAECLGWKRWDDDSPEGFHWTAPWDNGKGPGKSYPSPPNFHGDLNAIALAEATLSLSERFAFCARLKEITNNDFWSYIHATAPQRCEAFLRVRGKWEDGV